MAEVKRTYYKNGALRTEVFVINGKSNGEFKTYYENGNLKTKCSLIDNILNGEYKSYDENENPVLFGSYIDGKRHGEFKTYSRGELHQICSYIKGKITWIKFYSNGVYGIQKSYTNVIKN